MEQRTDPCQQVRVETRGSIDVDDAADAEAGEPGEHSHPVLGRARGRMADEVYDTLLGQLMSLRIEPGSRVTIDALARELGVSQTPIRDALNRMEADGLVVRVPHAGYRIPPQITRERFEDMLEVRLLLEPAAARRAAERASAEQVAGLRRMLDDMADLVDGDRHLAYGAFGLRDAAFHDLVAQSAGNQVVREALARLHTHVHLFRLLYDRQVTFLAMGEHDEVLAAVAARDPDAAAYAMRRHILLSGDRFRRLFDKAAEGADDPVHGA
jgi:DNA-binding GntR family transcriptional regulator